jgi:hypothetical protein
MVSTTAAGSRGRAVAPLRIRSERRRRLRATIRVASQQRGGQSGLRARTAPGLERQGLELYTILDTICFGMDTPHPTPRARRRADRPGLPTAPRPDRPRPARPPAPGSPRPRRPRTLRREPDARPGGQCSGWCATGSWSPRTASTAAEPAWWSLLWKSRRWSSCIGWPARSRDSRPGRPRPCRGQPGSRWYAGSARQSAPFVRRRRRGRSTTTASSSGMPRCTRL